MKAFFRKVWAWLYCFVWAHDWECVGNMWFKCRRCGKEEGL